MFRNYSTSAKFNDETVWQKVSFKGIELDVDAKRLVLVFSINYWVNSKSDISSIMADCDTYKTVDFNKYYQKVLKLEENILSIIDDLYDVN